MQKWKILDSKPAFDNKWFRVIQDKVELPNGRVIDDYFYWSFGDIVNIIALTKEDEILLVKQYKHGAKKIVVEVPAGFVDAENTPLQAAQKELRQETGYISDNWQELGILTDNPTKTDGREHVFVALDVVYQGPQQLDENEEIEVMKIPFKDLFDLINQGDFNVPHSLGAICLYLTKSGKINI